MSLDHPPKGQLIAFGQGKLAADESSSVEQHLEVCRECCETLLDLKDDTFVGLVRIARPDDVVADASRVRTELASDARPARPDTPHPATMLVQSGEPISVDELPAELREHPRYRIVELIGRGGMGNVYRAEHRLMNREVALKLINSQLIRHPQAIERFRREVQAAAKLTHPNIVTAYDAEQAGDVHFLVMEFVEGTDLASVVKHRGAMSVAEACECIRQAAVGLQHAHEKGMVHRDIKPHNLMLSAEGQVRILDFGLAGFVTEAAIEGSHVRQNVGDTHVAPQSGDSGYDAPPSGDGGYEATAAHLTTTGSVMGTPDYIAPEQAKDAHSADIRADIYSLGCTLHFLLTGKPPFVSDSLIAKLKAHAELVPESLAKLRGDVPQELSNVVARMMAKKPAERFQTPAAVAEALAPYSNPAASPPRRRVRTLVAALCMGFAALLAGVIFVQTSKGRVEIQSEVDDVELVIKQSGEQIDVIDITTGSQVTRLPSGEYEIKLKGNRNDIEIKGGNFALARWGKAIVTLKLKPDANGIAVKHDEKGPKDAPPPAIAPFDAEQAKKHQEAWAKHLGVPVEHTNSIGMKFVLIPPGEFTMGSTPEVIEELVKHFREANNEFTPDAVLGAQSQGPQHKVILTKPRYLAVHEVTQAQYEKVMGKNPSHFAATGAGKDVVAGLDTANHPVEMTSENDAADFCAKLSQKESLQPAYFRSGQSVTMLNGNGYRLPTEAEWEFSCRAGSTTRWWFGDKGETLVETAWIIDNAGNRTHAVGELRANPFGLHDIHGNVLEWCQDKWELTYYGRFLKQPALDPQNTANELPYRVARGGSWNGWTPDGASSSRWHIGPISNWYHLGFRVSLDIDAVRQAMKGPVVVELPGQEERKILKATPLPAPPKLPQRRTGLLTNPPKLPPEGVLVGRNLIVDPSLEETPTGELPPSWFAWLDDGPGFKCEVVEGGVTGKRCLQISGAGTRGVVFATSIPLDRTKRFALKGRVKVEGEAGTWAVIKLNYFNNTGWLGVDDRVGVSSSDLDWKFLEKTDLADKYPTATLLVPTCHIEGNGTAWFDDLEVIAYDRNKLPADFDAKHGKNNRMK